MGRMDKDSSRAGQARKINGQDEQGQFTGRTGKGLDGLDVKKAGCQLIWFKSRAGCPDENGTAQSKAILFGHFGL